VKYGDKWMGAVVATAMWEVLRDADETVIKVLL
jgi:hypothetical protein